MWRREGAEEYFALEWIRHKVIMSLNDPQVLPSAALDIPDSMGSFQH